jgi:hypothetical protein
MRLMAVVALIVASAWPAAAEAARVAAPKFERNIATGETGWFSSPSLVDLDGDRRLEIVAPFYSTFVYDARGRLLGKGTASEGRVYAPGVVADLDRDGVREIVVGGNAGTVAAYNLAGGRLQVKPGWPASTCSGGQCPETRGMAAADLDGDGRVEVVATTTNTARSGSQVFVFEASGAVVAGWPRYNAADAAFNGIGNHGYGAYGENVGIGNLDGDPQKEVVVTFDNHQINVFNHRTRRRRTRSWSSMARTAPGRGRHKGFRRLPRTRKPAVRPEGDWYPPSGIPAPTIVNLGRGRGLEIVAPVPDGSVYAVGLGGKRLWRHDYARGAAKTFASEVVAADLNRDRRPELVFGVYGAAPRSGRLVVLSARGRRLHDIRLRDQGSNGNGIGVPAAPSIGDLDRDGNLEIVLSTFDHGIDVYRVPRSRAGRTPWPTGRGNLLRNGAAG